MPSPPPKEKQKLENWMVRHITQLMVDMQRVWRTIPQTPDPEAGIFLLSPNPAAPSVNLQVSSGSSRPPLQGFLAADLEAPEDALGPPTTVAVDVYQPVSGTLTYVESITVYNYDTTLTGLAGTYCKCEWIDGQRQIYWLACEPTVLTLNDTDGEQLLDTDGDQLLINL